MRAKGQGTKGLVSGSGVTIQDQGSQFTVQGLRSGVKGYMSGSHESGSKVRCQVSDVMVQGLRSGVGGEGSRVGVKGHRSMSKVRSKVAGLVKGHKPGVRCQGSGLSVRVKGQGSLGGGSKLIGDKKVKGNG